MSKAAKVLTLVVVQAFNAAVGVLFLPYLVRALSVQDYGTYGQALLVSDIARSFFMLGLPSVLYVHLSRSDDGPTVFKCNIAVSAALGLAGTLAMLATSGALASEFHNEMLQWLLKIQAATVFFQVPTSSLNALLIYVSRVKHVAFNLFFTNLMRVLLTVGAIEAYHSLPLVFATLTFVSFLQLALALASVPRNYLTHGEFKKKHALAQFAEGFHLGLTQLVGLSMLYTDRFMVSTLLSVRDFAIFRNGTIEIPLLGTLYTNIASIVLPEVSKHYSNRRFDDIVALKRKLITVTAAIIYPMVLFLIIFSLPLVTLYFTEQYASSAIVFSLMSAILLFRVNDYMDILVSASKGRLLVASYVAAFFMNVMTNFTFIRLFGYWGAALSTLIATVSLLVFLFWASARVLRKSVLDFVEVKNLALILGVSLIMPLALRWIHFRTHQFGFLALYGAISACFSYFIFLKTGVLPYSDVSPMVRKIPLRGAAIDAFLAQLFPQRAAATAL